MRCWAALLLLALSATVALAQSLDDWVESSADPQELQAWWDDLRQNPLDLNRAAPEEIALLPLFDRTAAREVIGARRERGGFRTLDEALNLPLLTNAQRDVLRSLTTVQLPRGWRADVSTLGSARGGNDAHFTPDRWSSRLRAIFRGRQQRAFLFGIRDGGGHDLFAETSFGIELSQPSAGARWLMGDFQCETGTGLVFASPFGMAQWLASSDALGPSQTRGLDLRPSNNRRLVLRGAATEIRHGPLNLMLMGNWSRRDAAIGDSGAERLTEGESASSEELAAARKGQVEERLAGGSAQVHFRGLRGGAAGYVSRFDPPLAPDASDGEPGLQGSRLRVSSVFISADAAGVNLTSEFAVSNPGGVAHQTALSCRGERVGLALYHLRADEDFFSPRSVQWDGFGAAAQNAEVTGARIRAIWPRHTLTAAMSVCRTPFRTATSPLKKTASLLEMHWRVALPAKSELYLRLTRRRGEDASENTAAQEVTTDAARAEWRLENDQQAFRVRFELRSAHRDGDADRKLGSLLFMQGTQRTRWLEVTARITVFHLENSDVAPQVYELPLRGEYPLVTLSGSGRRATLLLAGDWAGFRTAAKVAHERSSAVAGDHDELTFGLEFTYRR
jgi:hypothetical protein